MSNGEHEIRTPKGLRIGNRSVVDGKNMLQIKRGGCEDYISAESLVERIRLYEPNAFASHLIRRLVLVPPYFVFCSISFRCGGLSIERNQKPLTPENALAVTHHDKQKQVEVKRSSRANPHEIRLFSGCPYAVVK